MNEIALAQDGMVSDFERLALAINDATATEASEAYDKLALAREWAKLQADSIALIERLVWIEALILRRIGQLDPKSIASARRPAARHFAALDDAGISSILHDYPARTAVSSYNLWARAEGVRASRRRGKSLAFGSRSQFVDESESDETLRSAINQRVVTVRQAAAVIVDEYAYGSTLQISVSRVVDEFIDDEMPIHEGASPLEVSAFRSGLASAVRQAFVTAPVESTERSWEIPAFITVHDEETDEWCRIPSEYATVGDARQMLRLRRGQVESMSRALANLERVFEGRFNVEVRECGEWLRDDVTAMTRRMVHEGRRSA